jgi:hypothetical protein
MKKIYLSILFFFCISNLKAQSWELAHNVLMPLSIYPGYNNGLALDDDTNFYLTVNSDSVVCLLKFDFAGNESWRKYFYGIIAISEVATYHNDVFLSGSFSNSFFVDTTTLTSAGMNDGFLLRLNSSGNCIWARTMGGTMEDQCNDLAISNTGNIIVTGKYSGTATFETQNLTCNCTELMFIAQYDSTGNLTLLKSGTCELSSNSASTGTKITTDSNNNIYVMGSHTYFLLDTFEIAGGGGPYGAWFVCKLDSSANVKWARQTPDHTILELMDMTIDSFSNIVLTGYSFWTSGGGSITSKYNSSDGQVLWEKTSGGNCYGDWAVSEAIASTQNNFYIIGRVDLGGNCGNSRMKFLLIKYDAQGNELFHDTIQTTSSLSNFNIIPVNNNEFIVCGRIDGTLILGGDTLDHANGRIFIAKFKDEDIASSQPQFPIPNSQFQLFPNPTTGQFVINSLATTKRELKLYNSFGQLIHQQIITSAHQQIDLSGQTKGIYFLEAGGERRKIVLD